MSSSSYLLLIVLVSAFTLKVETLLMKPEGAANCTNDSDCSKCETCVASDWCFENVYCSDGQVCDGKTGACVSKSSAIEYDAGKGSSKRLKVDLCYLAKCGRCYKCNPETGGCEQDPSQKCAISVDPPISQNRCLYTKCGLCYYCNPKTGGCEPDPNQICPIVLDPPIPKNRCLYSKCGLCYYCDPKTGGCKPDPSQNCTKSL